MNVTAVGLASAVATFAAGALLQGLKDLHLDLGPLVLDRYRVFFLLTAAALIVPIIIRRRLPEER